MPKDTKQFVSKIEKQEFPKFRKWLIGVLKEGFVKITFVKSDGTDREMNCTLRDDTVVPYEKKSDREKKENNDIVPVWDIDKNEWRSFRLDSIKNISFTIGNVIEDLEHEKV